MEKQQKTKKTQTNLRRNNKQLQKHPKTLGKTEENYRNAKQPQEKQQKTTKKTRENNKTTTE